jgi:hypothetical protein
VTSSCPWCYQPVAYGSQACAYCRRPLTQAYAQQQPQQAQQAQYAQPQYAQQAQPAVQAWPSGAGHAPPSGYAAQPQASQQHPHAQAYVPAPPAAAPKPASGVKFALIGLASLVVIGGGVGAAVVFWPSDAEGSGSALSDFVPKTVGDYTLGKAKHDKKLGPGITDALVASYKSEKGKDVEVKLYACASSKKASETYQRLVDETKKKLAGKPLSVEIADIQEGGKNVGELRHMVGATEVFVWYEGELAATVAGPFDDATKFFRDCPRCPAFQ